MPQEDNLDLELDPEVTTRVRVLRARDDAPGRLRVARGARVASPLDAVTREPKPVAPLILKTAEEKRRWQEAGERRKARLALRYKKQRSRD